MELLKSSGPVLMVLCIHVKSNEVIQQLDYDEFGMMTRDTNPGFQPFGYAGGICEASSGLTRFGVRDYDAESGRWTSKDPIGFNGGDNNIYGFASLDPINIIDPNGLNGVWSNYDSLEHYWNGGGITVDLNDIGHLSTIKNSPVTVEAMERFHSQINAKVAEVSMNRPGLYEVHVDFKRSYSFIRDSFFIGNAILQGEFNGIVISRAGGGYFTSGNLNVYFYDRYTDPYDVANLIEKDYNPNGIPYDIVGKWEYPHQGSGCN